MTRENEQLTILGEEEGNKNQPVTVLGKTFSNDQERREYFTKELKKKLPELKAIEGYPIGEDEDILALSDPPYYTACPNPWLNDFIEEWTFNRNDTKLLDYHREPFAADVSEGKFDPIYKAHSYHTKVPHKAIMRFILHYTNPGDVIGDLVAGTGMTGVAAQECGNRKAVESLGYEVKENGDIIDEKGQVFSKLGSRKVILNDLSPAASFISHNYNSPINNKKFEKITKEIIDEIDTQYGWMYQTIHTINGVKQHDDKGNPIIGQIKHTVWSDIFICSECSEEIIFWDAAVDLENRKIKEVFECPHCNVELKKRNLVKAAETIYDSHLDKVIMKPKELPVLIQYLVGKEKFEKKPDEFDFNILEKVENIEIKTWYPTELIMNKGEEWGDTWRKGYHYGLTSVHHFYTKRNLIVLSKWLELAKTYPQPEQYRLIMTLTGVILGESKLNRYLLKDTSFPFYLLSGTMYVASQRQENFPLRDLRNKAILRLTKIGAQEKDYVQSTQSSTELNVKDESVDYLFIDPPFGSNLMYSELNFITESWLKVITNNEREAIENKAQKKDILKYKDLMQKIFTESFRILKSGRWMTVEFSNSRAVVWNTIREAIEKSGFVIANVAALDKKMGSFKAITSTTAVKQDLVISAYKPSESMRKSIKDKRKSEETAWSFVKQHLKQLPTFMGSKGEAELIVERTPRVLFDRMIAYHVQNGLDIPISSSDFQSTVMQKFPMRDGMAFLESQVAEYDKQRTIIKEFSQVSLFVSDENSAIEWIRQQLIKKPQTRQDLHPNFMKEIQHIDKHELLPELDDLLEQNFLKFDGEGKIPDQIVSYLRRNYKDLRDVRTDDSLMLTKALNRWYVPNPNKQADLEKLREKSLLREFESYLEYIDNNRKKLKQFRTEAIRAGFKQAWGDKDYQKIVDVGERLPEKVIQEDDKLLMYFDNAQIRLGM